MSDADTIRDLLLDMGNGDTTPEQYDDALAALDRLKAQIAESEQASDNAVTAAADSYRRADAAEAEVARLRACVQELQTRELQLQVRVAALEEALRQIAEQQPNTVAMFRTHGIVFAGPLGNDPGNWEQVAFSIYTNLCEVDSIARAALAEGEET